MILVIGPARSGTSATAGILHHLGVNMGTHFERTDEHNPQGYYSDYAFRWLHLQMQKGLTPELIEEYKQLVSSRPTLWGLKCHAVLPYLTRLVPDLLPVTHVIRTSRSREESATSLVKKRGCEDCLDHVKQYLDSNDRNIAAFLEAFPQLPLLQIEFTELQNAEAIVKKVADFVGLPATPEAIASVKPRNTIADKREADKEKRRLLRELLSKPKDCGCGQRKKRNG